MTKTANILENRVKTAFESIVLNHLKFVLNYRQIRSDKKIEVFKEIPYTHLLKILKDPSAVKSDIAKGIQEILNDTKDKIDEIMPGLRYDLDKTPWADSILLDFTLTPKLLLEHDHAELIELLTLINIELQELPTKIQKLFLRLNSIIENKKSLIKILREHDYKPIFGEFETIYSKRYKLTGVEEKARFLESFIKNYKNLVVYFEKGERYFVLDIEITGRELLDELKVFVETIDQFFDPYSG